MTELFIAELPDEVREKFERQCANILRRHEVPEAKIAAIVGGLRDVLSYAVAGFPRKAPAGPGKPLDVVALLLAENVPHVLKQHGVSDAIWRALNDEKGLGGPVSLAAELEAYAQTTLSEVRAQLKEAEAKEAEAIQAEAKEAEAKEAEPKETEAREAAPEAKEPETREAGDAEGKEAEAKEVGGKEVVGKLARPARISKARKLLQITRS